MKTSRIDTRVTQELLERIKKVAIEGNVSLFVRQAILEKLERDEKENTPK